MIALCELHTGNSSHMKDKMEFLFSRFHLSLPQYITTYQRMRTYELLNYLCLVYQPIDYQCYLVSFVYFKVLLVFSGQLILYLPMSKETRLVFTSFLPTSIQLMKTISLIGKKSMYLTGMLWDQEQKNKNNIQLSQVSVATGCAARDRNVVFASGLATFFTRAYDQLRMAAISDSNINLCGSHCGLSVGKKCFLFLRPQLIF